MAKRRIILVSVVFFSLTVFTVQTLPRTPSSNRILKPPNAERLRNMTEEERKKEAERMRESWRNMTEEEKKKLVEMMRKQQKLEREQRRKESAKRRAERSPRPRFDVEQKRKESQERLAKIKKEFLYEKSALGATEEQWKVIKSKLEKVRHLRDLERSTVGVFLISSSGSGARARDSRSRNVPSFQWKIRWKDKAPGELTEAQKIANALMKLVDSKNTKAEEFRRKMDDLRESRRRQENLKKQLSEARQELREVLTTRQEAALVLMNWL